MTTLFWKACLIPHAVGEAYLGHVDRTFRGNAGSLIVVLLIVVVTAGPANGFGVIGTKWPPGPALPSPGVVSLSVMPAGLNMAVDVGGHGHNADLGNSTTFTALMSGAGDLNEVGHVTTAFDTWAAATQLANLGVVPDNGALYNTSPADPRGLAGPFGDIRLAATQLVDPPGPGVELAHAHFPPPFFGVSAPGDIHFNNTLTWGDVLGGGGGFDFQTVSLHELGHSLGLLHSGVPGSVMEPTYAGVRRKLTADDIAGINAIYGPQGLPPCAPPPSAYAASFHSYPGFNIDNPIHSGFPRCEPLPGAGQSSSHSFGSLFEGDIPLGVLDPQAEDPDMLVHVVGFGDTIVDVHHAGTDGDTDFFQTEILQLDVGTQQREGQLYEGIPLPPGVVIRQSRQNPTIGGISLNRATGQMDSFFDVWTEISFDGGQEWVQSEQSTHMQIPTFGFAPGQKGDLNGDGNTDNFDIEPFELALSRDPTFSERFPSVDSDWAGDINNDGFFDNFDIGPFEQLLASVTLGPSVGVVPEPNGSLPCIVGLMSCLCVARRHYRKSRNQLGLTL